LQLQYLYFEKPRFDSRAFENIITRNIQATANRYKDPANIISDSLTRILSNYNQRVKLSGTPEYFRSVKLDEVERIYRERMKDAGDFIFFIVGNIAEDTVKQLIQKYIGSISDDKRTESWKDNGIRWPEGRIFKEIPVKMDEPKSTVFIRYNKIFEYNPRHDLTLEAITRMLKIKYTETIREREGGTYGVFCDGSLSRIPVSKAYVTIYFDCKPDNAGKLSGLIYEEIENFKNHGPTKEDLDKVLLAMKKEREEALKRNFFWESVLNNYYLNGLNVAADKNFTRIIDKMNIRQVKKVADEFFSGADVAEIRFKPIED